MPSTSSQPTTARQLSSANATELADLASIMDDLQTVLLCCERLVKELAAPEVERDHLVIEATWTTTVLSYNRCFAKGRSGKELTETDVTSTNLQGEVLEWHKVMQQLRKHYAESPHNPRERFTVGATQSPDGRPNGIALTSTPHPQPDDRTVRQTGALAYELSRLVDKRITTYQERVLSTANAMSNDELNALPLIAIVTPDEEGSTTNE